MKKGSIKGENSNGNGQSQPQGQQGESLKDGTEMKFQSQLGNLNFESMVLFLQDKLKQGTNKKEAEFNLNKDEKPKIDERILLKLEALKKENDFLRNQNFKLKKSLKTQQKKETDLKNHCDILQVNNVKLENRVKRYEQIMKSHDLDYRNSQIRKVDQDIAKGTPLQQRSALMSNLGIQNGVVQMEESGGNGEVFSFTQSRINQSNARSVSPLKPYSKGVKRGLNHERMDIFKNISNQSSIQKRTENSYHLEKSNKSQLRAIDFDQDISIFSNVGKQEMDIGQLLKSSVKRGEESGQ